MNKYILILPILVILVFGCNSNEHELTLDNFINERETLNDTIKFISREEFDKSFDTLPLEWGELILEKALEPLPDTTTVRKAYYFEVDKFNYVIGQKTSLMLDPKSEFSKNTYFIEVNYKIKNGPPKMTATLIMDFDNKKLGIYKYPNDTLRYLDRFSEITPLLINKNELKYVR